MYAGVHLLKTNRNEPGGRP